jgi:starch-binding outer membrane protein, SusD/RagB family
MKTIKFSGIILTGLGLSMLSSCTDLVVKERDSIVTVSGTGPTKVNPTETLVSAYKDLGMYTDQANIYALGQHTSGEMIPPTRGVDWGDNGVWRTLDAHTWDAAHSWVLNSWNNLNAAAYKCNQILASDPTPAQAAEAKFLRALHTWHVMDFWGQVPFREVSQGVNDNPKVLSRSEAFDFIVKDLTEALPALPKGVQAGQNAKASKAAANMLLARLFLNKAVYKAAKPEGPYTFDKADMDAAIRYVDAVTADGYSIEPDYFKNFTKEAGSEIVLTSAEGSPQNRWFMTLHYNQNPSGWNGFTTLADFYDKFDKTDARIGSPAKGDGKDFSGIGLGFLIGKQIDDKGKDLVDTRTNRVLSFTRDVPLAGAATDKGIRVIKYHPATFGQYIIMRYSEGVLIKAEAQLRGGNTAGALATVNALRAARKAAPLTSLDANSMFDEIGRETYWEGDKRTVEVRFEKYLSGTGVVNKAATTVLFPIPAIAVSSNPNLKQNAGY